MKYFLDTEFHEHKRKVKFLGITLKEINTIDLISIGIVAEDGRSFYAISKEFDVEAAWNNDFLRTNVLPSIYKELRGKESDFSKTYFGHLSQFNLRGMKILVNWRGTLVSDIKKQIIDFVNPKIDDFIYTYIRHDCWAEQYYPKEFKYIRDHNTKTGNFYGSSEKTNKNRDLIYNQPEFYAYYADYDWVVFCWIFGRMIDLPKGFPKYCRDLKQIYDEKQAFVSSRAGIVPEYCDDRSRLIKEQGLKALIGYPKQEDEHNALADAKWNAPLYKFLMTIFT